MNEKEYFVKNLRELIDGRNISRKDAYNCLKLLLDKKLDYANDTCFGAFLASMETKKATLEEISGLMDCVIGYDRIPMEINRKFTEPLCGIIGSGKDDVKTFNVSSISAIVAASCGVKVLKNGSRSEASVAGTTDVFEFLGLKCLENDKKVLEDSLNNHNFAFCDVKPYFPRMSKEYMGKFFFVHPLSYILPIASGIEFDRVVFGLASDDTEKTAELLINLGYDNSMVVAGHDKKGRNFDEISNVGITKISEIKDGGIRTYHINPKMFNIHFADIADIKEGSSISENAMIFIDILTNKDKGPKRDIVVLNSGALIYISGEAKTLEEGIEIAKKNIINGSAYHKLIDVIKASGGEINI